MASVLQERMETLLAVSHRIRRYRRSHHQAHRWTH
uniref:F18L15.150 n=1 Tax=Arabidopsis thaliana TaxID=3702 RepID=Q9FPH7_ARATH|nr:F18L15.150 [Arabidopsis thaliana]